MIRLIKNTFYNELEMKKGLCDFITNSDRLSMGVKCKEFEEKFSSYQGRKYSVLYNSGSSANLALIQSLLNLGRLKKGDNIGFSALTWSTNVMPLIQLGLNPIPIDISLKNLNVNSENLLESEHELKALFITNLLGYCGDIGRIKEICKEKGIIFLEDNCESLGSEFNEIKLGNFGLASTFSFFVGHHLSTIEGGMVCTNDEDLYKMLLVVRSHGWDRNLDQKTKLGLRKKHNINDFYDLYAFYYLGYNLRPTEITGFLGCEQLKYIKEMCGKRMDNFSKFDQAARENPDFHGLDLNHMNFISNFGYPLIFKEKLVLEKYKKKFSDVEIRPIVGGAVIKQPFFKNEGYSCPNAEKINDLGFYIPNNPDLNGEEIKIICDLLRK